MAETVTDHYRYITRARTYGSFTGETRVFGDELDNLLKQAVQLLRGAEWAFESDNPEWDIPDECPWCGGDKPRHESGCTLMGLIDSDPRLKQLFDASPHLCKRIP